MKKSILILTTAILFIACHKETAKPAAPVPQTNTTSSINSYESSMLGNWKVFKYELWQSNAPVYTTSHNDSVNCHLNLTTTPLSDGFKKSIQGLACSISNGAWKADDFVYINLDGVSYQIRKLTIDTLILSRGDLTSTAGGNKYYLWK